MNMQESALSQTGNDCAVGVRVTNKSHISGEMSTGIGSNRRHFIITYKDEHCGAKTKKATQ